MNQERSASDAQVEAEGKPSPLNRRLVLVLGAILVLAAGGFLIFLQADAEAGCVGKGPCMLYFYAEWWVVCQAMEPIVDGLEEHYSRDFKIVRVDVDTTQGKQLAREQGIIGQPAYVFFDRSGEQVRRLMGAQLAETFERQIERILEQ